MTRLRQKYGLLIVGILLGISYGLAARIVFGEVATLASVTYLFIIPTILGIIPFVFADDDKLRSYKNIIFVPWLTVSTFFLTTLLFGIEDLLCLLVLAAPFYILATIGAFVYKIIRINNSRSRSRSLLMILLPVLTAPIEVRLESPSQTFNVVSEVVVDATPERVWKNIVEVSTIDSAEYNSGFFNSLGIPRPIRATIDKHEVGGHRIGCFDGGLMFVETITEYLENKRVSFDIKHDPSTVRQKVFDQHVLNGRYFNFINATYELVELREGQVRLTLTSSYQLTSTVNFYSRFWGEIILADFQARLFHVIENRCEVSLYEEPAG